MMARRSLTLALCLALVAGLLGCGLFGSDEDPPDSVTGTWAGSFSSQGTSYRIEMQLQQSESSGPTSGEASVEGMGTLVGDTTRFEFVANGSVADRVVTLSLDYQNERPGSLIEGGVSEDYSTIRDAELIGGPASFDGTTVTLNRQ